MDHQPPIITPTTSSSSTSSSLTVFPSASTSSSSTSTSTSSAPTTTSLPKITLKFSAEIWNSVISKTSPAPPRRSTRAKKAPKRLYDEMEDSAPAAKKKCTKSVKAKEQEKKPSEGEASSKITISGDGGKKTGHPVEREFAKEREDGDENEDDDDDDDGDDDDDDWTPPSTPPPPPPSQLERDAIMALMNMQRQRDWEARGETHGFLWESLNDAFFDSGEYLQYS